MAQEERNQAPQPALFMNQTSASQEPLSLPLSPLRHAQGGEGILNLPSPSLRERVWVRVSSGFMNNVG